MLTIDIGNSTIKWAIWQDSQPILAEKNGYRRESILQYFENIFAGAPRQDSVWVACVSSKDIEQALKDWMKANWSVDPVFLTSQSKFAGVFNAYPEPAQLGVDRWAALLGAKSLYKVPVCIIDVGTAVTVDLMDAEGVHRGGRIMPGIDMMRQALLHQTIGVNEIDGECPGFAINTADAVSSGTLHMLLAALVEIYDSAKERLGDSMKMVMTGGASEMLVPRLKSIQVHHEPHLVLHGLYYASEQ